MDLESRFWEEGFAVLPSIFDRSEVGFWRKEALVRKLDGDLFSHPRFFKLIADKRIIDLARKILAAPPIYFGDSTVTIGTDQGSGFHRDNSDRYDFAAPDWGADRYPVIRFGIYTQEHGRGPGGIDFLENSHSTTCPEGNDFVSPAIRPGDLVVWSSRILHSANSPRLRLFNIRIRPNGFTWQGIRKIRAEWIYRTLSQQRVAFFMSYGADHPLLDRHISYLKTRRYAVSNMEKISWPAKAREIAERHGLRLLQPIPDTALPLNDDYHPLPYDGSKEKTAGENTAG